MKSITGQIHSKKKIFAPCLMGQGDGNETILTDIFPYFRTVMNKAGEILKIFF